MATAASVSAVRRRPHELEEQVLAVLHTAGRPLGGVEIARRLGTLHRPVVPMLVFRALAQLIKRARVCKVETFSAYMIKPSEPAIMLLCGECRTCRCVPAEKTIDALEVLASSRAFSSQRYVLEVQGRCAHCQSVELSTRNPANKKALDPRRAMM